MEVLKKAFGPNLTRASKHVAAQLKTHKMNELFQDRHLLLLLQHQPRKVINPKKVEAFVRAKRPPYNRPCLYAVVDGDYKDFSYVRCLRKLYGLYDAGLIACGVQSTRFACLHAHAIKFELEFMHIQPIDFLFCLMACGSTLSN